MSLNSVAMAGSMTQPLKPGWPSADCTFESDITAMSRSPDGYSVIVAGREILQMARLEAGRFGKKRDVRAGRKRKIFSCTDVSWHPLESHRARVATSSFNGNVLLWDIHKSVGSKDSVVVLHEGNRTVNRICWNREFPNQLLAGSQGGTVSIIDVLVKPTAALPYCDCRSSVRDVQFSPFYPNYCAAALESGGLMIWDLRKTKEAIRTFYPAHQGLALCVDWHPSKPDRLASGGRDRLIKVWDLKQANKPIYKCQTMATVHRIQWRSAGAEHEHQIASAASHFDVRVHVWDFNRPYLPVASCLGRNKVVTGIQWLRAAGNTVLGLFSVSKDGFLSYHELSHDKAYRPIEYTASAALSWSPIGQLACVTDVTDRNWGREEISAPPTSSTSILSRFRPAQPLDSGKRPTDSVYSNSRVMKIAVPTVTKEDTGPMLGADPTLNPKAFKYTARNYSICTDDSFRLGEAKNRTFTLTDICMRNSQVAHTVGLVRLAKVWVIMGDICSIALNAGRESEERGIKRDHDDTRETRNVGDGLFSGIDTSATEEPNTGQSDPIVSDDEIGQFQGSFRAAASSLPGMLLFPSFQVPGFRRIESDEVKVLLDDDTTQPLSLTDATRRTYGRGPRPDTKYSGIARKVTVTGPNDFDYGDEYDMFDEPGENEREFLRKDYEFGNSFPDMIVSQCSCGCGCNCGIVSDKILACFNAQSDSRPASLLEPCSCACGCGTSVWNVRTIGSNELHVETQGEVDCEVVPVNSKILVLVPNGIIESVRDQPNLALPGEKSDPPKEEELKENQVKPTIAESKPNEFDAMWLLDGGAAECYSQAIILFLNDCLETCDLQTYVTMLITLAPILPLQRIDLQQRLASSLAYIEILRRIGLHDCAAEIIKNSPDEQIRNLSHNSTLFRTSCGYCQKGIDNPKTPIRCDHCKKKNSVCSICQMTVQGAIVSCEGCGHGGHLRHMRQWFKYHGECASGCGHQCDFARILE